MKLAKISVIAAIVLGGLVASSSLTMAQDGSTNGTRKGKGFPSVEQRMERMDKDLNLTAEQKPKVKAVLEESGKKMQGLRDLSPDERGPKMRELRDEQNKKLKEILTADQYKKYEESMQRRGGKNGKKKNDSSSENK